MPVLAPGQVSDVYQRIWDRAFQACRGVLIAKTVRAAFSVNWLAARYEPTVLLIERNPVDVALSLCERGDPLGPPHPHIIEHYVEANGFPEYVGAAPYEERAAWWTGLLMTVLEQRAAANPSWVVTVHEVLSSAPEQELRRLSVQLGLRWSHRAVRAVREHNAPGEGYATRRTAIQLQAKWTRHPVSRVQGVLAVLALFPRLAPWTDALRSQLQARDSGS